MNDTEEIVAASGVFDYEADQLFVELAETSVSKSIDETGSGVLMLKNKHGDTIKLRCECAILTGDLRKALGSFVAGETW